LSKRPKTFKLIIAAALLIGLVLAIWSIFIEPNRLVVHSATITIRNWPKQFNNLKIVAISDLHAGSPFINETKLRQIVELANAQQPDLIILLGDYMADGRFHNRMLPEQIAAALKDLQAPLGVYTVLGNHDWYFNGPRVRRALEDNGIKVLDNEVAETKRNGETLWLVGLADLWTRPQDVQGTLAKVPAGATIIALTHNPDTFVQLPANVPLLLAGHTHGGQVNLPLLGRLVVPSSYGQRFAAGQVEENGRHLFVTTGVGTSILPLRFRVPPEIAMLTVSSTQ
jgi:predicted MPP superfamily phosphohydrolase